MILEFPELRWDKNFLRELNVIFNANNYFEHSKKMGRLASASGVASDFRGMVKADQTPFWHPEYIALEIYGLTEDDLEKNKRLWERDAASTPNAEAIDAASQEYGEPINPLPDFGGGQPGAPAAETTAETTEEAPTEETPTEGGTAAAPATGTPAAAEPEV